MLAFYEKIIKIVYSVKLPSDWLNFEQTERHATAAAFNIHMIYNESMYYSYIAN